MKKDEIVLIKETSIEARHSNDRPYRTLSVIVLTLFISIFGIWAALAPLSSAVPATGKVIAEGNRKVIQHLEGGIVSEILVKDGDKVSVNQPLIRIDTTRMRSELEIVNVQHLEALARISRLRAERDKDVKITFAPELIASEAFFVKQMIEQQTREFNARKKALQDEEYVMQQRIEQLQNQVNGLEATLKSREELLISYTEEVKEWQKLYEQQLIDKMRLRDVTREKTQVEGEIASIKSDISRLQVHITEIKTQNTLRKQDFLKEVLAELSDMERRALEHRARIESLLDVIERSDVRSPVDGIVVNMKIHTIGAVISPGNAIMDIVPNTAGLIIDGKVAINEVNYVHNGLRAEVLFSGFSHIKSIKPVIGELIEVSADSLYDQATNSFYYSVKIRLLPEGIKELERHNLQIMPGMPADAMILTGKRTLLQYMIKPFKNMFIKGLREE